MTHPGQTLNSTTMTAKEFVKSKIPTASAERHVGGGRVKGAGEIYWLIRKRGETMYIASGKTESNAWVNAKEFILKKEQNPPA